MSEKLLIGYKLVRPYPFQKIGDVVKFNSLKEWRFEKTNLKIEKRLLETDFFEPFYFDRKIGDEIIFKDFVSWRHAVITKVSGEDVSLKMLDGKKPKTQVINYSKIIDKIVYYHFNSLLQPCLAEVTSLKKMKEMDERVLTGNCFETKEECKDFILRLKELLKKRANESKNIQETI